MDWTKAKKILIIALLITNIFLAWNVISERMASRTSSGDVVQQTIQLLKSRNIYVNSDIPIKYNKMPVLEVLLEKFDKRTYKEKLKHQTALSPDKRSEKDIIDMTKAFIEENGLFSNTMRQESITKQGNTYIITYRNYYDGIPIENSYLKLTIEDGKIVDISRFWLKPTVGKSKRTKEIMPSTAALIKFMSEQKAGEIINISDIELVYWIDTTIDMAQTASSDTALPTWKITYNNGKQKFYSAYDE